MGAADTFLTDSPLEYARPVGLALLGSNSHFARPYTIRSPHRVHIGHDIWFGARAYLSVVEAYAGRRYQPTLRFGDRCIIDSDLLVHCAGEIEVGSDVVLSKRVFLGDSFREYTDPTTLPIDWPISEPKPVRIGDGAYLGTGVAVLSGVEIGARAIISAGAVVTRDVPPRSVVVGNPARVVSSWDDEKQEWRIGGG